MKLFIWTNFCPDWKGGLAFAIAKDVEEARRLVVKEHGCEPYDWGVLETRRVDRRVARSVSGGG